MSKETFMKANINGNKPKSRMDHAMVCDGVNTAYIFGGNNVDDQYFSDLWSFKCMLYY